MLDGIIAIVPVRAGSKRLPNKNLLPFGKQTLLEHKISQLQALQKRGLISEILISSDSEDMLSLGLSKGVSVHKRAEEFADEVSRSFSEVIVNIISHTKDSNKHILWSPCVCPLCGEERIAQALETYECKVVESNEFDSVVSVVGLQAYLWDSHKPLNYQPGKGHIPSQNLPKYFLIVNGFYIAPRERMLEWEYFFGKNPYRMEISEIEGIDIDTKFDYMCAKAGYELLSQLAVGGGALP